MNELVNAVVGQLPQAPAQPIPQPAAPAAPVAPAQNREPKVADPPKFSGDRNEVQSFIRSVRTCFVLNPSRFPDGAEMVRILFALGFMQGGTAGAWADNIANGILDPNVPNPYNTFQEFQEAFERAFGSLDRAQKARTDMATLKMKPGDTVEEYTTSFETLALHTGYNEAGHIEAYRSGLLSRIVEKIYSDSNGQLPVGLHAWKTKARHIDHLYHEFKSLQLRNSSSNQHKANRPAPPKPAVTVTATPSAPEAMDVDGHRKSLRCYNCNKFGHISRNCPEPKRHRSIRVTDIAEAVRAVLNETATIKEEKPEEKEDFQAGQQ
jgi:hypothetical protein